MRHLAFIAVIALAFALGSGGSATGRASVAALPDGVVAIHDVQGAGHLSPLSGQPVTIEGVVTARRTTGFYVQGLSPDENPATSEGIFVYTSGMDPAPVVALGDRVRVSGTVKEYRSSWGGSANLTVTEIADPGRSVAVLATGVPLPAPVVVGARGRVPPSSVIEDDATGDVETSGIFDPAADGIDFYESLEGMRVQVDDAVVVGPTNGDGEIVVVGDGGASAGPRTVRGGLVLRPDDPNPERIILDGAALGLSVQALPKLAVADRFAGPIVGVVDYSNGNYKLEATSLPSVSPGGLGPETAGLHAAGQLAVATLNVENLSAVSAASRFAALARVVVESLRSPDLIAVAEIQDDDGATNSSDVSADRTWGRLIAAIAEAGGPTYDYRQIDPVDNQDGGQAGGNIRQGFLFRTDRGLGFVDRPGGTATAGVTVVGAGAETRLSISPGRIDPGNPAFADSRKPLVGEFTVDGRSLFVVACHLVSKTGDDPLFGRYQPPRSASASKRVEQAQAVRSFVDALLAADPDARVVVLGDLNDYEYSEALAVLKGQRALPGGQLLSLIETLPAGERYTYVFDGNSQALDHVLVSGSVVAADAPVVDVVHVGAELAVRPSDHDPVVAFLRVGPPGPWAYRLHLPLALR